MWLKKSAKLNSNSSNNSRLTSS